MLVGTYSVEEFNFELKFSYELVIDMERHIYTLTYNSSAIDHAHNLSFGMRYVCKNSTMDFVVLMSKRIKYALENKQVQLKFNDVYKNEIMLKLTWGNDRGLPSVYNFILKNRSNNTMLVIREKELKNLKRKYEELEQSIVFINKTINNFPNNDIELGEIVEHAIDKQN